MVDPSEPPSVTTRPMLTALVAIPLGDRATLRAAVRTLPGERLVGIAFGPPDLPEADRRSGDRFSENGVGFHAEDLGLRDGSWNVLAPLDSELGPVETLALERLRTVADAATLGTFETTIATDDVSILETALAVHFGVALPPDALPKGPETRIRRLLAAYLRTSQGRDAVFLHRGDLRSERFAGEVVERLGRLGFAAGTHLLAQGVSVYAIDNAVPSYPSLRVGTNRVRAVIEEFGGTYTSWEAVTEHGTIYSSLGEPTDLSLDVIRGTYS